MGLAGNWYLHSPGIQYSDVHELVENGAKEIILTRGVLGRLKVQNETTKKLRIGWNNRSCFKNKRSCKALQ